MAYIRNGGVWTPVTPAAGSGTGGGGVGDLVSDGSPELGGNLDLNGYNVGAANADDLTKLHEITATSTELNYVDGVTSAVQTQLDTLNTGKVPTSRTVNGQALSSNITITQDVVGDTTPQLGGDLDLNGHNIGDASAFTLKQLVSATTKRFYVDSYANLAAAVSDMGSNPGILMLGPSTYSYSTTITLGPGQSIEGLGAGASVLSYTGTGDAIRARDTRSFVNTAGWLAGTSGPGQGGSLKGFTLKGTSSGASGIHVGDLYLFRIEDVQVSGFTGTGAIGVWFDNRYTWMERARVDMAVVNCTNCVVYDHGSPGTDSFGYGDFKISVTANSGQHGFKMINAAVLYSCTLDWQGNFETGSGNTGVAVSIGADSTAAKIAMSQVSMKFETNGTTGVGHKTFDIGSTGAILSSHGILEFLTGGSVAFATGNASGKVGLVGTVDVDTNLGTHSYWQGGRSVGMWGQSKGYIDPATATVYLQGGNVFSAQLTSGTKNLTIDTPTPLVGTAIEFDLFLRQPASGTAAINWPVAWVWPNGAATLSITSNAWDHIRVIYDGATYFAYHMKSASGTLPSQTGNAGKVLSTDGSTASWTTISGTAPVYVNVKDYGAVGNGTTNDTAAIEAAFAVSGAIYFPESSGGYVYNGAGLSHSTPRILGAHKSRARILLGSTSYLINHATSYSSLNLENIDTVGGKGAIKMTYTGDAVNSLYTVKNCIFQDYTECAIAVESSDNPYWTIENCKFDGADTLNTIGVAVSGLSDMNTITRCMFIMNRVHVKIRNGGNNMHITNCDFIKFSSVNTNGPRVDIWVVPWTNTVNGGQGFSMSRCKLGNEGIAAGDYRILYADELTGASNGVRMPNLAADSTGFIMGHQLDHFMLNGKSGAAVPIVYSTTPNVRDLQLGDVEIAGTKPTYALEFRTPAGVVADRLNSVNIFGPFNGQLSTEGSAAFPISNVPGVGYVDDPNYNMATLRECVVQSGSSRSSSYSNLLTTAIGSFTTTNATMATATDPFGGTEAQRVTFSTTAGAVFANLGALTVGKPVWVEFDLKAPSSGTAATRVKVILRDNGGNMHWVRTCEVPTHAMGWKTYAFPFTPRTVGSTPRLYFSHNGADATGIIAEIAFPRVYHSYERLSFPLVWIGTQAMYNALGSYDAQTIYHINDAGVRVTSITSSGTPTFNTDACDMVSITAQAAAITSMTTNATGTPGNGQKLLFRIKDNGTARAITWGSLFQSGTYTLPTTTVAGKTMMVGFIYDSVDAKWTCESAGSRA